MSVGLKWGEGVGGGLKVFHPTGKQTEGKHASGHLKGKGEPSRGFDQPSDCQDETWSGRKGLRAGETRRRRNGDELSLRAKQSRFLILSLVHLL